MPNLQFHHLALLAAAGLGCGIVAKRFTGPSPASGQASVGVISEKSAIPAPDLHAAVPSDAARSTDTLESLASLKSGELYSRLALWLVDAGEEDIAAYWQIYQKGKRSNEITTLIFLNWTRLNPQAVRAAAGSVDEEFAWRAWACNDPQGALAAAIAAGGRQSENVARGLGQFHPAWLREHFNEIPETARKAALSALDEWGDSQTPLETLDFVWQQGMGFSQSSFKALVSKDPWAALDRVKGNPSGLDLLVSQMADESPDELARLAARSPSGEARRRMETALFANLARTDPEAAIAEAKAADVPRIAAERFAMAGLVFLKTDPGKALEMAENLMATYPDAMMVARTLRSPDGGLGGSGSEIPGTQALMRSLMFEKPGKVMDMIANRDLNEHLDDYAFAELSDQWAQRDMAAYAQWVTQQTDPQILSIGTDKAIRHLQNDGQYQDAADWAMTLSNPDAKALIVAGVAMNWARKNQAEALEWLEAADLPAEDKSDIRKGISP